MLSTRLRLGFLLVDAAVDVERLDLIVKAAVVRTLMRRRQQGCLQRCQPLDRDVWLRPGGHTLATTDAMNFHGAGHVACQDEAVSQTRRECPARVPFNRWFSRRGRGPVK